MSESGDIPAELLAIRQRIDDIDQDLVALLAERFKLTHEIGLLKANRELDPLDPHREAQKLEALTALSEAGKLDPDLVRDIFRRIMQQAVRNHERLRQKP